MGLFRTKEIECRCLRCGSVWYTTKNEIRESKRLKQDLEMAKLSNKWRFPASRAYQNNMAKIAVMQSAYINPMKCPNCGTLEVECC